MSDTPDQRRSLPLFREVHGVCARSAEVESHVCTSCAARFAPRADAGRIAEEVISHLVGQVGAEVTVTIEIEAKLPNGANDQLVRTVTENSRTLKFDSQGFERE